MNKKVNCFGASIVEFTITLPLFLGIIFTTFDISNLLTEKTQLDYAVSAGLRNAVVDESTCLETALDTIQDELLKFNIISQKIARKNYDKPEPTTYEIRNLDGINMIRSTFSSTNSDYGPYNNYKYLDVEVDIKFNCLVCNFALGALDNLTTFKKTYKQILMGSEPLCLTHYEI